MSKLMHSWWNADMATMPERWRPYVSGFVVFFAAMFFVQFPLVFHHLAYLGPGLGDDPSTHVVRELIVDRLSGPDALWGWSLGLLLLCILSFRAFIMLGSYFGYERTFGHKFPIHLIVVMILINAVGALSIPLIMALLGMVWVAAGAEFIDGWLLLDHIVLGVHQWIVATIPTVIKLPTWLAVLVVFQLAGFFHYWLHRLGHQSRGLWLLFHRHHHLSTHLSQFSTTAVFFAFPLFIVFIVPYTLLFGAITKLFSAEPLYQEIFLLNLIFMFSEVLGHSDVFYEWGVRKRWLSWPGFAFCNGVYHYLHHSAEPRDAKTGARDYQVNMINIGGGFCFLWDMLFGTYQRLRDKKPPVGLTGQPPLYYNPLRLALGGLLQLVYEWQHNKDWHTRWKILFGSSDYTPPLTREYILKQEEITSP